MVKKVEELVNQITSYVEKYGFNLAAETLYDFAWHEFADVYIEDVKNRIDESSFVVLSSLFVVLLKLLHPFMPFITEELWRVTAREGRQTLLVLTAWPGEQPYFMDAQEEVGWLIDLVSAIRSVRTEMNVAQSIELPLVLVTASATTRARAQRWGETIQRLARISQISLGTTAPQGAVQLIVRGEIAALPLADPG